MLEALQLAVIGLIAAGRQAPILLLAIISAVCVVPVLAVWLIWRLRHDGIEKGYKQND